MFLKLRWVLRGRPTISYPGYNCGLCGVWIAEPFIVNGYNLKQSVVYGQGDSLGIETWGHTWGLCQRCIDDEKRRIIVKKARQLGR